MSERSKVWLEAARKDAAKFEAGRNGSNAGEATSAVAEAIWAEVQKENNSETKRELEGLVTILSAEHIETIGMRGEYFIFLAGIVQGYARLFR